MKHKVLFMISHQPNPRFVKQINYFADSCDVTVVYYRRDLQRKMSFSLDPAVNSFCAGEIPSGKIFLRPFFYLKSFLKVMGFLRGKNFRTAIFNNIDSLLIYKIIKILSKDQTELCLEISDLRKHTYLRGIKHSFVRCLDRSVFRFVNKLIVTSPKFYSLYYNRLFPGNFFNLENKPLKAFFPIANGVARDLVGRENPKKIKIGVVGLLLQGDMYKVLINEILKLDDVTVSVFGVGPYEHMFSDKSLEGKVKYYGAYDFFEDAPNIYSQIDVLFMAYDVTGNNLNNKVALPNKLYEAMAFKVPVITSKGSYVGEIVQSLNIGEVFDPRKPTELRELIRNFDTDKYEFEKIEEKMFFGDDDYKDLIHYLELV
tara:strand:+ start:7296 stop:8408 length:1113 start_codon:yes stop_codon:yes gene_type:complete